MTSGFSTDFSMVHSPNRVLTPLKSASIIRISSFVAPSKIDAPQTKILEGRTNLSERVFEALFKGVSTRFGLRIVEKCFPGKRILKLCIPNEDLVRMNKR